jgi:hypothetical protein
MKFRTLALVASAALLVSGTAFAAGEHQFGIEGGTSLPSGEFGDAAAAGFNVGGFYQFMMGDLGIGTSGSFGAGAEVKYNGWGSSSDAGLPSGTDASMNAWQVGTYATWALPMQTATPYAKVGAGWYGPSMKVTSPGGNAEASDGVLGMSFGGGADFSIKSSMTFGVGFAYHILRNKGSEVTGPGGSPLDTDFYSVNARVMWPFKMGH